MELRKRTRTATAKVLENNSIKAEAPTPRRTRKARRTAPDFPERGNEGPAEAGMEAHKSLTSEEIGSVGDVGSVGSNPGAEDSQSLKEKIHVVYRATADGQPHEDESISKKRRKVGMAPQEAESYEDQDTATEPGNENNDKKTDPRRTGEQEEIPEMTEAHGEKWDTQYENGNANLSSLDNQSQTKASLPAAGGFLSGVELPIQPNKRKDNHTGSGAENESEALSTELTPKRPRRSTNEEGKANNLNGRQDSLTKRAANGKGRAIKASPAKSDVAAQEFPVPSSRQRPRVTYKELSDVKEGDEPAPVSARGNSLPRNRSNKKGKAGVGTKQEAIEQLGSKARKGRKGIWDKGVLLTSKRSRLAKAADLSDVLNSTTWDLLSTEEQKECLALLPSIDKVYGPPGSNTADGDLNGEAILAPDFFESNQVFKDSLLEFQDDLIQGRYEPSYIAEAANARKARLEGAVDKYKDGQYELFWGQRQHFGMIAGAAANIKLPELIQKGLLKAGDIWAYKRTFDKVVVLEKEVTVAEVNNENGKYSLVFHIPPGKHKFPHPSRDNIVVAGIVSPQTLENAILRAHPDTPDHIPNGNSFKVFKVWRKGEDLGLLWEIRQTYWGGE
ncbi:Asx homology domain-containing protein [Tirmania nivea]|nr:Asx homology domain-containing protein [Tirmania nivea]